MKQFEEADLITKLKCGSNLSFILKDGEDFLLTEYKVLQSQANHGFLKCMKMLYNGKVQLYYLSSGYKTLQELLSNISSDQFITILGNLFSTILEAKSNGFLSCQNIDIRIDNIYIDPTTLQVYLIYLPLQTKLFEDYAAFENELRTSMIKLIQQTPTLTDMKTVKLAENLANGIMTLDDIQHWLKGGKSTPAPLKNMQQQISKSSTMKLILMDKSRHLELLIDKEEYTLGKSITHVDGVLSFNKMISRIHCKICKRGTTYFLSDLHSANGTFLNQVKLFPEQEQPIHDGDMIRLANSDFRVVIR